MNLFLLIKILYQKTICGYVLDKKRMENGSFLGELYHIKKLQPNWIAVFFMYALGSLLLALRFAPCSNVLASAMRKQTWHCARLVVTSPPQSRRLERCRQRFEMHRLEHRNRLHRSQDQLAHHLEQH